jgi:hypothetical protein
VQSTISRRGWAGISLVSVAALAAALLTPASAFAATPLSGTVTYNGAAASNVEVDFYSYNVADDTWSYETTAGDTDAAGAWAYGGTLDDGIYATYYYTGDSNAIYATDQGRNGQTKTNKLVQEFTVTGGAASITVVPTENLAINAGAVQFTLQNATTGTTLSAPAVTSGYASVGSGQDASGNPATGNFTASTGTFNGVVTVAGVQPGTFYYGYAYATGYSTTYLKAPVAVAVGQTTVVGNVGLYPTGTASVNDLLAVPRSVKTAGLPKVGTLLTATIPAGAATPTYQWVVDDGDFVAIPGATSQTYVPTVAQLGSHLAVRVTFSAPNYTDAVRYSDDTDIVQVGDPNAVTVKVTGTKKIGHTLSAAVSGGTVTDAKTIYQWYRAGAPIAGAVGSKYVLVKGDVGQKVFASVTSFAQGHTDAVIPSNTVSIAHDKVKLAYSAKTSISKSTKLKVKVNLKDGASNNNATGTVRVYYSAKKFKKLSFSSKSTTKTATLPKLSKGKHTIKIKYYGDTHYLTKSTSFKVTVK